MYQHNYEPMRSHDEFGSAKMEHYRRIYEDGEYLDKIDSPRELTEKERKEDRKFMIKFILGLTALLFAFGLSIQVLKNIAIFFYESIF